MASAPLPEGLYELLISGSVRKAVTSAEAGGLHVGTEEATPAALEDLLSRHLSKSILTAMRGSKDKLETANKLQADLDGHHADPVEAPGTILRSVTRGLEAPSVPNTPLSMSALLTGAIGEPRLGLELERELASADRVDALVSFVTWEGWRRLQPSLTALVQRKGALRLITTTYTGATDADAVAAIAALPGVEVKLSYDGRRTRLHAKAWLFHRASGFSTAWVGSANLSGAALSGGLEWTIKASNIDLPYVLEKFAGTFETLWNDPEFETFVPADLTRLQGAIDRERGRSTPSSEIRFFATLAPFPFQEAILLQLASARALHQSHRNLVVAATGTGKTLISAFDYLRQIPASGIKPRLLFVAHRDELLQQSLEAFRHVLRDASFGERLGAGYEPASYDHLFTTVQSFASRGLAEKFPRDHWDYVVVDECHHSTAKTYREVVEKISPKILLGLTATPERADGVDILQNFDGRIAAEIRLWHALDKQLLAPFDYYGIADGTDLRDVEWARGGYASSELEKLYTGNDRRAELIIAQFRNHRGNVRDARALGFCVTVEHAQFMARKFNEAGIPAAVVHGGSTEDERKSAPGRLLRREVNVVFTCDLYNEGVDLPFVDTLLFLRPTNSATVFLQQLGRGLRLHPGKSGCLVLDFIGQCRKEFRFDHILSASTGIPRGKLAEAVEQEFPTLPSGCALRLDSVTRSVVLENLTQSLKGGERRLALELAAVARSVGPNVSLAQFLEHTGRPLEDVYAIDGFSALRAAARLDAPLTEEERAFAKKLRLLLHTDDPRQLSVLSRVAEGKGLSDFADGDARRLQMLGYQLWHESSDLFGPDEALRRLNFSKRLREELGALAAELQRSVQLAPVAQLPEGWALELHRSYERREVLAGIGAWNATKKPPSREGVVRVGNQGELFFVTLVKDEKKFSPTTRYRDYAISPTLFHWQTQSGTPADGEVGRRYRDNTGTFWLLVRRTEDEPYRFLGDVRSVSCEGSKPVNVTWRLTHAMPPAVFRDYASLAPA